MNNNRIEIEYRLVSELIPYAKNPRKNDKAVEAVAESIKEFGFKVPVIIDGAGEIVAGHTRIKAAKKLGIKEVPCILADDLSEEQVKAFRLADNKAAEIAEWDDNLLSEELAGILDLDMTRFGFDLAEEEEDEKYTMKVNIPQYEITGECPEFSDMLDSEKADYLIEEIEASSVTDEEKAFLIQAARRHNVFNYRNIAEYYAHASAEMQALMEKSALVIIDVDDAIANGYAKLSGDIMDMLEGDEDA